VTQPVLFIRPVTGAFSWAVPGRSVRVKYQGVECLGFRFGWGQALDPMDTFDRWYSLTIPETPRGRPDYHLSGAMPCHSETEAKAAVLDNLLRLLRG
jgi:hypothetical protein